MKWHRFLAAGLSLALLAGCAGGTASVGTQGGASLLLSAGVPADPIVPGSSKTADEALGRFGVSLLREMRTEGENTLISPLSVLLCLSMCANGAEGDTLQAFLDTLGGGVTLEELNANCASLVEDYLNLEGSTQCNIAGSLWLDEQLLQADEDFLARCAAAYRAGVYQADLSAQQTVKQVNQWVKEQTQEMIDSILDKPLSEDAALMLVNALYLKNAWQREFDPRDTWEEGQFYPASGETQTCSYLCNGTRTERYFATELGRGVVLPYDDGRLGFLALLPEDGDLTACLEQWDGGTLPGLLAAAEDTRLLLRMPKFEAEWGGGLTDALAALGLDVAFDPAQADFSGMGQAVQPLFLSSVLHKTRIKVNEKGTEAAAVTAAIMECAAAAPIEEPEKLILDHPFLYGIVDLERGVPLFLGTFETA